MNNLSKTSRDRLKEIFLGTLAYDMIRQMKRRIETPSINNVTSIQKEQLLRRLSSEFNLCILVETGTYVGDMLYALRDDFKKLLSIELSDYYHQYATKRLLRFPHIELILGDSATMLAPSIAQIKEPILFWLDGHYSGSNTAHGKDAAPLRSELRAILERGNPRDVVGIDDCHLLNGDGGYPTKNEIKDLLLNYQYPYSIQEESNVLIIAPLN